MQESSLKWMTLKHCSAEKANRESPSAFLASLRFSARRENSRGPRRFRRYGRLEICATKSPQAVVPAKSLRPATILGDTNRLEVCATSAYLWPPVLSLADFACIGATLESPSPGGCTFIDILPPFFGFAPHDHTGPRAKLVDQSSGNLVGHAAERLIIFVLGKTQRRGPERLGVVR